MLPFELKSKLVKLHILVADERDMLSLLVPYLQDMGAENIHRATDGNAAVEMLHKSGGRIDMVICDWDLPKMNGMSVLKFVRERYGKTPFLMLASQVTRESLTEAAQHGVNGYLAKPFTVQLLEKRVAALIRALPAETQQPPDPAQPEADAAPDDDSGEDSDEDSWMI